MTMTAHARTFGLLAILLVGAVATVGCTSMASASQEGDRAVAAPTTGGGSTGGTGDDPGTRTDPGGAGSEPGGAGGGTPAVCESCDPIDPDEPVTGGAAPVGAAPADGAQRVKPEPGIVNATPHAFDHVDVSADGRTLTIYYYGGVDDCYGLASVDVSRNDDGSLGITILEGGRPGLGNVACIEIAVLKSVEVTIDQPVFVPGDLETLE